MFRAFRVFIFLIFGFVPKVCDTENTDLLKMGKKRDLRPTPFDYAQGKQRSGATKTVASDVSVGRLRSSAKHPFFGK